MRACRRWAAILLLTWPWQAHAFQTRAHLSISEGAMNELAPSGQAPDVTVKYRALIIENTAAKPRTFWADDYTPEIKAHGGPNGTVSDWLNHNGGPFDLWLKLITDDYKIFDFPKAYTQIGYLTHLMEDQHSPLHAANVDHGAFDHFEWQSRNMPVPPGGQGIDAPTDFRNLPGFYRGAVTSVQGLVPNYRHPATAEQYWLVGADYQGQARSFTGHYGRTKQVRTCDGERFCVSNTIEVDFFESSLSPGIIPDQTRLAVRRAAGLLLGISKLLPPLIEDASLSPENWPGSGPLTLTVRALENRTRDVRVTAEIYDSGGALAGTPLNRQPVSLDAGSRLPWEKDVSLDVDVSGLASGTYQMKVTLRDGDDNDSESRVLSFTVDRENPNDPRVTDPRKNPIPLPGPGLEMSHDQCLMITGSDAGSGICSISLGGFGSSFPGLPEATLGPVCPGDLPDGCYTATVTDCSGRASSRSFCIRGAVTLMTLRTPYETQRTSVDPTRLLNARLKINTRVAVGLGSARDPVTVCLQTVLSPPGGPCTCPTLFGGVGYCYLSSTAELGAANTGFSVTNTTNTPASYPIDIGVVLSDAAGNFADLGSTLVAPPDVLNSGASAVGSVEITAQPATIVTEPPPPCLQGCIRPLSLTTPTGTPPVLEATVITAVLGMSNRLTLLPQKARDAAAAQGLLSPMFGDGFEILFASAVVALVHPASIGMRFTSSLTPLQSGSCIGIPESPLTSCPRATYTAPELETLSIYGFNGVSWEQVSPPGRGVAIDASRVVTISSVPISRTGLIAPLYRRLDKLPPVTALALGEPIAPDGRTVSPATPLALSVTDDAQVPGDGLGWGTARTEYAVDGGPFQLYRGTFSIASEGAHTVRFFSVDHASNTEAARGVSLVVDATPPGPPILSADGSNPSPWSNTGVYLVAVSTPADVSGTALALGKACDSPLDGSDGAQLRLDGVAIAVSPPCRNEGSNPLFIWLMDGVGNGDVRQMTRMDLRYDSITPDSYAQAPSTASSGPVLVRYTASDPGAGSVPPTGSGLLKVALWYRVDTVDRGIYGPWQAWPSTMTAANGQFVFTPASDGGYQFYTRAADAAGNAEVAPLAATPPKAETFYDATPAVLSNVRLPLLSFAQAQVAWSTDDLATGLVEYGTTTALGHSRTTPLGRGHLAVLDCSLFSPATIYYRITAVNRTGLTTVSPMASFVTPPQVTAPVDIFGVIDPAKPIDVQVTNPAVMTATFTVAGQTASVVFSTSTGFKIVLDPSIGSGMQTLRIVLNGFTYETQFLVDTATRSVRLARAVLDAAGVTTDSTTTPGSSVVEATLGEAAQESMSGPGSRLYLGYYAAVDPVAPAMIPGLSAAPGPGAGEVSLGWTAVGDDAGVGTAMKYDLRRSTSPIANDLNFAAATPVSLSTFPALAGTPQRAVVSELADGTTYYFAVKAVDELLNASAFGGAVGAKTLEVARSTELTNGRPTVEFLSFVPGMTITQVSTTTTEHAVALATSAAAAQGLLFYTTIFDIVSPDPTLPGGATVQFRYTDPADPTLEAGLRLYEFKPALNRWILVADVGPSPAQDLFFLQVPGLSFYAVMYRDAVAPATSLELRGGRQFVGDTGSIFASATAVYGLTARDPPQGGRSGSGVARTEYRVDSSNAPFTVLSSTGVIILTSGIHTVQFRGIDNAGNVEPTRGVVIAVDAAAPVASLGVDAPSMPAPEGLAVLSATATLTVSLQDPLSSGGPATSGSGVESVSYRLDGGGLTVASPSFNLFLTTGTHLLALLARDQVGNLLDTAASPFRVVVGDVLPPRTAAEFGGPGIGTDPIYLTSATPVVLRSVDDLLQLGDAAGLGVAFQEIALTSLSSSTSRTRRFAASVSTVLASAEADGLYALSFFAEDAAGNREAVRRATVAVDNTAPLTSLSISTPTFDGFVSARTTFSLKAVDPTVNGAASGAAATRYRINAGSFLQSPQSFNLTGPDGIYTLEFQSQDKLGNQEILKSSTAILDTAPPVTTISIAFPTFTASDGTIYVATGTPISFGAADPALPGGRPGSGLARIETSLDGAPFVSYAAALTLIEGRHVIAYRAVDNVGNVEPAHSIALQCDAAAPSTTLTVSTPYYRGFVSTATVLSLSASDPVTGGAASGVAQTRYRVNAGSFTVSPLSFGLSGADGSYAVEYQSRDNVENLEVARSTIVVLDQTPPVTTVQIGAPVFTADDGMRYVTPATPVSFMAVDPSSGSGVSRIEVGVDGAAFTAYVSALTFLEGPHTVLYRSVDNVGNVEAARTLVLRSDATPPLSALYASGAFFVANGRDYAPSSLTYTLSAADPAVNAVASGVAATSYRTGQTGPFATYTSTFSLSEGVRRVDFRSQDNVKNVELLKSATVFVDETSPVTALAVGNPKFDPGDGRPVFVAAATPLTLSASDPEVEEVASGVRRISLRRGTDALAPYVAPFTLPLPDGLKTVSFFASDNVDNTEAPRSVTLALDDAAPVTSLAVLGGRQFPGPDATSFYASADTRFGLPAADPVIGGVASGLALTQHQDNGGAFQVFASTFGLPEGAHLLAYRSQDRVQNLEVLRSTTALIDATAPVSSATISSPRFIALDGTIYITPIAPVTLSAVDPSLPSGQPGSGTSRIEVAINGGNFSAYSSALTFAEGRHTILYRAVDNVANVEAIRTLNVQSDAAPPLTELAVIGGRQASSPVGGTFYASLATRYALSAADPLVNDVTSGVALTRYRDNGGSFAAFASPLSLTEGSHALVYQSQDNVQNLEVPRSTTVLVDATAPVSSAAIGSPLFVGADGARYITPSTPVTLSALDPVVNGVASGVERVEVAIDGGAFAAYLSPLVIAEGSHTVLFRALDRVGNIEAMRRLDLQSDNTPPVTAFAPSGALFTAGDRSYAPAQFTYVLPAQDPVAGNVASGVAFTRYRTTLGAYQNFTTAFSLSEGIRRVEFQSQDNVKNVELLKSATVFVDATAPVSALAVGNPKFDPGDGRPVFVAAATPLTLSAQDPVVQEVASDVRQISLRRDGGAFGAYTAPFRVALPDGFKTVAYFAADNVGNAEVAQSTQVALDDTAPLTSLSVLGGRQFPGPNATSFYASSDTRLVLPAFDPAVNGVASGLALTQWQDNGGAFQTFTAALALPEGSHALGYQSRDRVSNMEVPRSTTVLVDATPPVTTARVGAPLFVAADGTNYVTPATPVTFTAVDPTVSGVASGVNRVEAAVDGGPFTAYSTALTFAEGRHTILYRAVDNVANVSAISTLSIQSDAAAPESSLAIGAPSFDPGAGPVIVAAATLMTLSAQDPVVSNVASGVRQISFRRGGEPFGTYAAPFTLPLPDGIKTLDYLANDNVGNVEATRSTTVALDNTPPLTTLAVLGGRQFPGPDAASFYASADTRFSLPAVDPVMGGVASGLSFTQWQDNSGAFQMFGVPFGLPEGRHLIAFQSQDRVRNTEVLRSTTVLVDATAPVSSATIGSPLFVAVDGINYITPATPVKFSAVDPALPAGQPGSGVSLIEVAIDGGPFAVYSFALTFAEGRHTIQYRAVDNVANAEVVHTLNVRSDATLPTSSLVVDEPKFQLPSVLLVSTRTPFSIATVDPIVNEVASGVKDTFFRVSGLASGAGAMSAFTAPFTMAGADADKIIEFYSRDNVLNAEAVKSSTARLDSTPPEAALLSPATCDSGICRVLKGRFPVLGTARDLHFGDYRLEYAAGQNAGTGFALISSGTLAVSSGTLGIWDATALSGWFTVRLTATDLVLNAASVALNVFVGDPGRSLVLGNHEIFNMPEGVAVGRDGKIYVADRNNDRVAVFSSTGGLLASFGRRQDQTGEHRESTTTLRLSNPSGVAVDASGNIYVADTQNDRVLKLSAMGQILLNLGRRERDQEGRHEGQFENHGRLPGQFHHPAGVAVDAAQAIYVADTENRRVQVFSSTGAFRLQFNLPPVPARDDRDDDADQRGDHDDDAGVASLGKPFSVALDDAGNVYVADPKGRRALGFDAAGRLLLTLPIAGEPFGVAVSTSGRCLLVSDRKNSRILKFDFLGSQNLDFAVKGRVRDDDAPAPSGVIVLKKPMGLALDPEGDLFVADRNNNRIQKFGLPTGKPTAVAPPPKPGDEREARDVVDKEDGGKVERRDRAAVEFPAGAVAQDMKVTVSPPAAGSSDESSRRRAVSDAKLKVASPAVEYGPEGSQFKTPVTLTLPYSPELAALGGVDEKDLKVNYWNREKAQWQELESVVDPKTRTVKAKTTHFSLYQVFSGTAAAAAIAPLTVGDPTFIFRDAYAFPNPVRGSGPATIRLQAGLADSVEVHVYDVSGRKIHSSSNFTLNTGLDDGNGKGVQYTYDQNWDVSGVGSGVYLYVITAKKAGQADIHKTGRVGIVK